MEIPEWHKAILDERLLRIENGEETFYNYNEAIDDIIDELTRCSL